jgi:hypothetical protein
MKKEINLKRELVNKITIELESWRDIVIAKYLYRKILEENTVSNESE